MSEEQASFHQLMLANIEKKQFQRAEVRAQRVEDAKKAKTAKPKQFKKVATPPPIPKKKPAKSMEVNAPEEVEAKSDEPEAPEPFPEWKKSQNKPELLAIAQKLGLEISGKPVSDYHTKKKIVKALRAAEKASKG